MDFVFHVKLEPAEDGGFVVSFPDVPGARTQGDTRAEALSEAVDALESRLVAHMLDGEDLPRSRTRRGPVVRPTPLSCMKLAVYQAMRDQRVGKAELARRLKWHLPQVDRVLDLRHSSRVDQIDAALAALGLAVRVAIEKAA